eukprot:TRINITY_DN20685_c0_g1_i2.p2 TRINITY_DN20685_c0_g1~~TRINITY_DN20685_c0_g1_i2.p2  ORF type:complete len:161 (-),score=5.33 TRINITY_DN20685_c0_g1_i2:938-1420(-)
MVLTGILALLVQNVLALFPIEGNMEMARVVSYLFTLFLLTFHIRRMVQCFADTHERVDSFKLENAKCFSEEDRPIVQANIILFLKHCGWAEEDSADERALWCATGGSRDIQQAREDQVRLHPSETGRCHGRAVSMGNADDFCWLGRLLRGLHRRTCAGPR